jgi:hypothetical protein
VIRIIDNYVDILAPLTSATDLPHHPTLSIPFTSKVLTTLADQGGDLMRKENQSLWRVKHLLTRLCGDYSWAPCGLMIGPNDIDLYADDFAMSLLRSSKVLAAGGVEEIQTATNGEPKAKHLLEPINGGPEAADPIGDTPAKPGDEDASMADAGHKTVENGEPPKGESKGKASGNSKTTQLHTKTNGDIVNGEEDSGLPQNGDKEKTQDEGLSQESRKDKGQALDQASKEAVDDQMDVDKQLDHEGSAALVPITQPDADLVEINGTAALTVSRTTDESSIHPLFFPPPNARPDRDLALPEQEAEDIRRLLALYIQKQEEVCRGSTKLYEGLLKADRLRKSVLKWSKAEAHCGLNQDMSDGEDWYDKEEWGLAEDLKKGQDEEEEDTGPTAKKTRNRR